MEAPPPSPSVKLPIVRVRSKKTISGLVTLGRFGISSSFPGKPKVVGRGMVCVRCRGSRFLCGKPRCPILVQVSSYLSHAPIGERRIVGDSPPAFFVGRMGYPKVFAGPLVPPTRGDTSILDLPERWVGLGIDEIVSFRVRLVRGVSKVDVRRCDNEVLDVIQELALSSKPVGVEMGLRKPPTKSFVLDDDVQPLGPSAPLDSVELDLGVCADHRIEKVYSDTDLPANAAILELYSAGVPISRVQKSLSAGLLGLGRSRRLVPTRWSITAVDDTIGKTLVGRVRGYPWIGEYRVHEFDHLDNRFVVVLVPDAWGFEFMEAWYPGTTWNPGERAVYLLSSCEYYRGRKSYAPIGGCYYAARFALVEHLVRLGRQARAIVFREAYPGYLMPVGVWHVRESVRKALASPPVRFDTLEEALSYVSTRLRVPLVCWGGRGTLLYDIIHQQKLVGY